MNKELISSFKNLETNKELRTVITATGEILFCLSDICNSLNLTNPSVTKKALENEYGKDLSFSYPLSTSGGEQFFTFIPESHVYFLVFRSNKEEARKFRNWVTEEVLPSLRRTGSYNIDSSYPVSPYTPELLAKIKRLEEELEVSRQGSELVSLSSIADFYHMDEPALKSLLKKLGVDLSESSFRNYSGNITYVNREAYNNICNALYRNFNRREFCSYKEDADRAFRELVALNNNDSPFPF